MLTSATSGTGVGLVREVEKAGEIVQRTQKEAIEAIHRIQAT